MLSFKLESTKHILILCMALLAASPGYLYPVEPDHHELATVHYLSLPVDHADPASGVFSGYYVVGPNQSKSKPPVFFIADGQMDMIRPEEKGSAFIEWFDGNPFILPFVRGFSPELHDRCKHSNGNVDIETARKIFASWQQVEDIEAIRLNLIQKGIILADGKISIYGASGGGILAQEYVTKYPNFVQKLILESTGSPVVARRNNTTLIRNLVDYNSHLASECEQLRSSGFRDIEKLSYVLYNLGRLNVNATRSMMDLVMSLKEGRVDAYESYLKNSMFNLVSTTDRLSMPNRIGTRIRLCEIWGTEIMKYRERNLSPINLGYEWVSYCLSDLLKYYADNGASFPSYDFDLTKFQGETLVIAGTEDVVFSPDMAKNLAKACNHSVAAILADGHGMENNWSVICKLRQKFLSQPLSLLAKDPRFNCVKFEAMK